MIDSFKLDLQARNLAAGTVSLYVDAAHRLGDWLRKHGDPEDWSAVTEKHVKQYMTYLLGHYADGYANNQYRAIPQFFKWYAAEEDMPNPMAGLQPPKLGIKTVPVFKDDELQRLIKDCGTGRDFQSRRDTAIIRRFAATGPRLSELAGLDVTDMDLANHTAHVLWQGSQGTHGQVSTSRRRRLSIATSGLGSGISSRNLRRCGCRLTTVVRCPPTASIRWSRRAGVGCVSTSTRTSSATTSPIAGLTRAAPRVT